MLLVAMNWIYSKWFYERDLQAHSDMVNLPRQVVADSCRIVYLGESSNRTYGWAESDQRKISDMVWAYFPNVRCGDMTKDASHAEIYYNMLKLIPKESSVETVVVTMNLRSDDTFVEDAGWRKASAAYSDFLRRHENLRVLYLEIGVGANTPVIIKYPFWQMTRDNRQATYACLNYGEAYCPREIEKQAICLDGDTADILDEL